VALWEKVEQHDQEIAEIRASINRLNKIVRANIRQAFWQSIALFISLCMAVAGGLAYQTSVLNKRFAQMEKDWQESEKKFAERSKLSEENLKTYLEGRLPAQRFGKMFLVDEKHPRLVADRKPGRPPSKVKGKK
jgi:hypothetical protein